MAFVAEQCLMVVTPRGLRVVILGACHLGQAEVQIRRLSSARTQSERALEDLLTALPVTAGLVDLGQSSQCGNEARVALEDLLENLARGIWILQRPLPDIGDSGQVVDTLDCPPSTARLAFHNAR